MLKYTFAALLALLSTPAYMPPARAAMAIEIVFGYRADERAPREQERCAPQFVAARPAPFYTSPCKPRHESPAALFQRPPPCSPLLA